MDVIDVVLGLFVLVLFICSVSLTWNEVRYKKKSLPPGMMGWPIIGETKQFLTKGPDFIKAKTSRYGSLFKTHILGCPTVISTDPDVNRYILMNESKGLVPGYPQSMLDILGTTNIAAVHGAAHKFMRASLLSLIGQPMIRHQLLPKIDSFMKTHLQNWDDQIIDIQAKTKQMAFLSALVQVAGIEDTLMRQEFMTQFDNLVLGTFSLPIKFPGTEYYRGVKGRENIIKLIKQLMEERKECGKQKKDMLGNLMNIEDNPYQLNEEQIYDQIITVFYSGYETFSTTSMMALKFLHDNPKVLQQVREEHFTIKEKKEPGEHLDWNDYKSMRLTRAVILETSRLATIVNGVFRKTTQNVELDGYVIPKGWRIYVFTRGMNYDHFTYSDPLLFNPERWLEKNLENEAYVLLFGGGTRKCPGKELGIVEVSLFLHHFITKYRWEEVGGDRLLNFPRVYAPKGLHIKVSSY